MRLIQPHCRARFAAGDMEFVVSVLGPRTGKAECLVRLLSDEESRDLVLDDGELFSALLERRGCLNVSSRFYFYILVRHVFRQCGIEDRTVADYVAEVLAEFVRTERGRCTLPGEGKTFEYFFEMLSALRTADDRTGFLISLHIGNYSLFLSGVFPERIRFRAEARGFPDLSYYEGMGRSQYRAASDHRLAHRYELSNILATLSERFQTTRLALNEISDRLFSIGESTGPIEEMLKEAAP